MLGVGFLCGGDVALAQETVNTALAADPDGTVKITVAAGSVRVRGWAENRVRVTGTLGAGSERLDFSVEGPETRIRVVLPRHPPTGLGGSELVIEVPRGSHVAVRTAAADIDIDGVVGTVDAESVSGGVQVRGGGLRSVYAQSAGGDVDLQVSAKIVRAKSVDGDVTVRGARGFAEVSTISGNATLIGEELWEGEVTTVSGTIRFEGSFSRESSFYFESHSGNIELAVAPRQRPDFEVISFSGDVTNEFEQSAEPATAPGSLVKVKTFKGAIRILKH